MAMTLKDLNIDLNSDPYEKKEIEIDNTKYSTATMYNKLMCIAASSIIHEFINENMKIKKDDIKLSKLQTQAKLFKFIVEYLNSHFNEDIRPAIRRSLILNAEFETEKDFATGQDYVTMYRILDLDVDENKFILKI